MNRTIERWGWIDRDGPQEEVFRSADEAIAEMQKRLEEDIDDINGQKAIFSENLRRAFDFIITLEEPILRDIDL